MTEFDLLIDLHRGLERQGPGSENDTLKALGSIDFPVGKKIKVADIGCGTGGQTLTLAENIDGHISAVDLFPQFLSELDQRARKRGLNERITCLEQSMDALTFQKDEFDMIWSEGAIYIIGFENGIKQWKNFLKPGGYLAISEITWISNARPKEIEDFWTGEYPEIDTASAKMNVLEGQDFSIVSYFELPPSSWLEHYYQPLEQRFEIFLEDHRNSKLAQKIVDEHKKEIDLYNSFKEYYSYGFYVARKN